MKDLLKEAIADAKAVRETALANAKLALEEAFTPRIQSMISAKLSEEMDDEDEPEDEAPEVEAEPEVETEEPEMDEPEMDDEPEDDDDDLDLDEILRELDSDEEVEEMYEEDEEVDLDELAGSLYEEDEEEVTEEEEEIDLEEIVRSLREEDDYEDEMTEEESMEDERELEEAYNVIRFLKSKINEVNLLNAKLLYSNKLFRNFSLNEGQKMKVIESFDRSATLREVKLVYSTLAESFKMPVANRKPIRESFASKPIASTKPAKRVLNEGTELANRFQKLAGLIK